jgi:hypothetical protein
MKLNIKILLAVTFVITCASIRAQNRILFVDGTNEPPHSVHRKEGFVPDGKTAERIAEAILIPIYGEKQVKEERPFTAVLTNDVWVVTGHIPENYVGGVALVEISKEDARIIRVDHGK